MQATRRLDFGVRPNRINDSSKKKKNIDLSNDYIFYDNSRLHMRLVCRAYSGQISPEINSLTYDRAPPF